MYRVGQKSKLLYYDRHFHKLDNSFTGNVKYSVIFVNGPGVKRKLATLILFQWLNILCYTLL